MTLRNFDIQLIHFFKKVSEPVARWGLFLVFFWFGFLKVIGLSPATPLVQNLYVETIPILPFEMFIIFFGIFECAVGVLFVIRGLERVVIPLLFLHMIATFVPLFVLPAVTWSGFLVPTLEGQYILKNVIIIAVAMSIAAHLHPLPKLKR